MSQWNNFRLPEVKKDTTVFIDLEQDKFVKFNLDVIFPRAPCSSFDI